MHVIISCEHASNKIPKQHASIFKNKQRILDSHRGWDIGAEKLATKLALDLSAPLFKGNISRLLIDLNRSLHHHAVFSEFTEKLDQQQRAKIIDRYYMPYRSDIERHIKKTIAENDHVIHFSIHSFTPEMNNVIRNCDLGLLYDPGRDYEKPLVNIMQESLNCAFPDMKIRRNYPYKGNADGLTTSLRRQFTESSYLGIELEINQKLVIENNSLWKTLQDRLGNILNEILTQQTI